jgi:hypothetical protein
MIEQIWQWERNGSANLFHACETMGEKGILYDSEFLC